jgi:hypothetical protein
VNETGSKRLTIMALTSVSPPSANELWDANELWVWAADPESLEAIQTASKSKWKGMVGIPCWDRRLEAINGVVDETMTAWSPLHER